MKKRIKLDLHHALDESLVTKYQEKVALLNHEMDKNRSQGFEYLGWKDLPNNPNRKEISLIKEKVQFLHSEGVEILIVIGIGGSYLGSRSAIDFIQGLLPSTTERKMEVIHIGTSISAKDLYQTLKYVQDRNFAINVISKSGTTLEPALAFREFRVLLEKRVGPHVAKNYIIATTDANKGILFELALKKKYTRFIVPDNIGGRFSVFTPVGLFPMACAGLNIDALLQGAAEANLNYRSSNLEENDAYSYAVARHILHQKYASEMLVSYEPGHAFLLEWWKQLFAESEGKQSKALLPTSALFTRDLHSLGQFIQDGSKVLFETLLWIKNPRYDMIVEDDVDDLDQLNYLADKSVHAINRAAFEGTLEAHTKVGQVPNIILELERDDEATLGTLYIFFERAVAMSAYLLGVNPFDQPGVEVYKSNMFTILERKNND